MPGLAGEVLRLAADLTGVLNATICDTADLRPTTSRDRYFLGQISEAPPAIAPSSRCAATSFRSWDIEMSCSSGPNWRFGPSSTERYIRTEWSQFGLFVWTKDKPAPFIRLEVEATEDREAWNVAHLQVHAESHTLGQVWGARKERNPRRLQDRHLPVGGFHYRPCLEDFIEFLIEERLVPGKPGWKAAIELTRSNYRRSQLSALIAKNMDAARAAIAEFEEENPSD